MPVRDFNPDGTFGMVNRSWGKKVFLEQARITWQNLVNEALSQVGCLRRVSHLSLAEQGIRRMPTKHCGAKLSHMARKGHSWAMDLVNAKRRNLNDLSGIRRNYRAATIHSLRFGELAVEHASAVGQQSTADGPTISTGIDPDLEILESRKL
jgi:hypothetical protein